MTKPDASLMAVAFIEPIDVLSLRGNLLFGAAGSYGESQMPPMPSVVSGALRSALLVQRGTDITAYSSDTIDDELLGRPSKAARFLLSDLCLARRRPDDTIEPLYPLPSDLVIAQSSGDECRLRALEPAMPPQGLAGSNKLPYWAVLAQLSPAKAESGWYLTTGAWGKYLDGTLGSSERALTDSCCVSAGSLWDKEMRIGIGMDSLSRRADDGKLFKTDVVSFRRDIGLLVRVRGTDTLPPMLRLGGDGHGATCRPASVSWAEPDYDTIVRTRRARIVLTSPGLFGAGWLPCSGERVAPARGAAFELDGVRGRIVCATTPRGPIVSGFDLAKWQPKPAQRAAAAGSVYWLDELEASTEDLRKLAAKGLWHDDQYSNPRRAEGFNRFTWAIWRQSA